MRIVQDEPFTKVVEEKVRLGMNKHVKKMCTKHIQTNSRSHDIINGMQIAASFTADGEGPVLLLATAKGTTYVFDTTFKTIEEWSGEVERLEKKGAVPTPRKVLSKMAAIRIRRIFVMRDEILAQWDEREKLKYNPPHRVPMDFPDLVSMAALMQIKVMVSNMHIYEQRNFERVVNDMEGFLIKPEVDDQIMLEGWTYHVTKEIMES